ncbi:unnamed protein product [Bodo saltans]|uniref:Membrane-associated protein n=1 Tax=Bodo saltans TaxID=75058 RepID=A0A0S4JKX5_BODSA|nr:unnamed protein product [Bodo saltans]|eukprot:CUG92161.1 unnamed protein product [Bodo saltans]
MTTIAAWVFGILPIICSSVSSSANNVRELYSRVDTFATPNQHVDLCRSKLNSARTSASTHRLFCNTTTVAVEGELLWQNQACPYDTVTTINLASNVTLLIHNVSGTVFLQAKGATTTLENVLICVSDFVFGRLGVLAKTSQMLNSAAVSFVSLASESLTRNVSIVLVNFQITALPLHANASKTTARAVVLSSLIAITTSKSVQDIQIALSNTSMTPSSSGASDYLSTLPVVLSSFIVVSSPVFVDGVRIYIVQSIFRVKTITAGAGFIAVLATENDKFEPQHIQNVTVNLWNTTVEWNIDKDTISVLAGLGDLDKQVQSYGVYPAFGGVVTVYTIGINNVPSSGSTNYNAAVNTSIENVLLSAVNTSALLWLHGTFLPPLMHPPNGCTLCGVQPSLFSVNGQRFSFASSHTLINATMHVVDSTFRAKGCSSSVIYVSGFLTTVHSVRNISLVVIGRRRRERSDCNASVAILNQQNASAVSCYDFDLNAQTPLMPSWNDEFANVIRVADINIVDAEILLSAITVFTNLRSGEIPGANSTALTVMLSSAVSLKSADVTIVVLEDVVVHSNVANGVIPPLQLDTNNVGSTILPMTVATIATALLTIEPLASVSALNLTILSCSLRVVDMSTTLNVSDFMLPFFLLETNGIVSLEIAAAMIGCTTQEWFSLLLADTTVETNRGLTVERLGTFKSLPILGFVSIVSMQTPMSLSRVVVLRWSSLFSTLNSNFSEVLARFDALPDVGNFNVGRVIVRNVSLAFSIDSGGTKEKSILPLNTSIVFLGAFIQNANLHVSNASISAKANSTGNAFLLPSASAFSSVVHNLSLQNCTLYVREVRGVSLLIRGSSYSVPFYLSGVFDVIRPTVRFFNCAFVVWMQDMQRSGDAEDFERSLNSPALLVRAWPNNDTIVINNSTWIVAQSTFTGFDRMFGSDARQRTLEVSTLVATTWMNGSQLLLGCNYWNGLLFPSERTSWSVLDEVPNWRWARSFRTFQQLTEIVQERIGMAHDEMLENAQIKGCAPPADQRLFSVAFTTTPSESLERQPEPSPLILPTISPNAALLVLASLDGVALISLGQSACGPAELKQATSATRFLLSPFYDYGGDVAALGNLGLILCIAAAHGGGVMWKRRQRAREKMPKLSEQTRKLDITDTSAQRGLLWFHINRSHVVRSAESWLPDAAAAQFPNLTIVALTYALNGICFASANAVSIGAMGSAFTKDDDDSLLWLSIVCGSVTMLCVFALISVCLATVMADPRHGLLKRFCFERYPLNIRRSSSAPAFVLPYGRWGPDQWRSTLGKLRSLVRPGKTSEKLAMLPILVACISNMVLGVSGSEDVWCPTQWTMLCLISLSAAAIILVVRPTRIPVVNIFLFLQYALQFHVYLLGALLQANIGSSRGAVVTVLMAISTLLTLLSIVKTIHTIGIFFWERQQNSVMRTMKIEQVAAFQPKEWRERNPQDDDSRCKIDDPRSLHPLFLKEINRPLREEFTKQHDRGNASALAGVESTKKELANRSFSSLASSMATRFLPPDLLLPNGVVTSSFGHSLTLSSSFFFAWQSRQPKNEADQFVALERLIDSICTRTRAVQRES